MYVVTFYSFKGGVGRSMALVNIACALALSGRRVLLIDFDLEAPGLDTFKLLSASAGQKGIVEYITAYLQTGTAPDVGDYVYKCEGDLSLWVMPSGKKDGSYGARLNAIDWRKLYSDHDGFLMFEDLKAQWNQLIRPDYVLIDSRTGHTDVGGICTRQLPDAVTLLFYPNEQNLDGLRKVVEDIRREEEPPRSKQIKLHFAPSNVPDLDDEDLILEKRLGEFSNALKYEEVDSIIHHYDSLALLDQTVFTVDRPRSRLANEYNALLRAIVDQNLRDRTGALGFLDDVIEGSPDGESTPTNLERNLILIRKEHAADGEVLARVGLAFRVHGRLDDAVDALNAATATGYGSAALFRERAEIYLMAGDQERAVPDLFHSITSADAQPRDAHQAATLLRSAAGQPLLMRFVSSPEFTKTDFHQRLAVLNAMLWENTLDIVGVITAQLFSEREKIPEDDRNDLMLGLMAVGRFKDAVTLISPTPPAEVTHFTISLAFNYGMAWWAERGELKQQFFVRALSGLMKLYPRGTDDRNITQCLAISFWAMGLTNEAIKAGDLVRSLAADSTTPSFSAWRYVHVDADGFRQDIDEMLSMFRTGEPTLPRFIQRARQPVTE